MAKRQSYTFEERKYSANGIASAVMGVASLAVLLLLLGLAFLLQGRANTWIGAVGFAGIAMAFLGLYYGLAGLKDECKSYLCSKLGTVLSTADMVAWFFIVCLGLVS